MTVIRFVVLVAENVSGRAFGEVAVTGMINDLPAERLAFGIGSIVGAPNKEGGSAASKSRMQQDKKRIIGWER